MSKNLVQSSFLHRETFSSSIAMLLSQGFSPASNKMPPLFLFRNILQISRSRKLKPTSRKKSIAVLLSQDFSQASNPDSRAN